MFQSIRAKHGALGHRSVEQLADAKLAELKKCLEADARPLIEQTYADADGPKAFEGEALPSDPDECLRALRALKAGRLQQIKEGEEEIGVIESSEYAVETLQKTKRAAGMFEQWMALEQFSAAKKPRVAE